MKGKPRKTEPGAIISSPAPENPPLELTKPAAEVWQQLVATLAADGITFAALDVNLLATLCELTADVRKLTAILDAEGLIITGRDGQPVKHPATSTRNQLVHQMRQLQSELGLTPASKARLPRPAPPKRFKFKNLTP